MEFSCSTYRAFSSLTAAIPCDFIAVFVFENDVGTCWNNIVGFGRVGFNVASRFLVWPMTTVIRVNPPGAGNMATRFLLSMATAIIALIGSVAFNMALRVPVLSMTVVIIMCIRSVTCNMTLRLLMLPMSSVIRINLEGVLETVYTADNGSQRTTASRWRIGKDTGSTLRVFERYIPQATEADVPPCLVGEPRE